MAGKRRDNGDGAIRQRPDGRWEARLGYIDPVTMMPKRRSVYGKAKGEVKTKLKELQDRLSDGQPATDASSTLEKWSLQWLETTLEASSRKDNTKALYASLIRKHIAPSELGAMRLDRIRPTNVEGWMLVLRRKTKQKLIPGSTATEEVRALADSTILQCFIVLRMVLDGTVRDGLLAKNPMGTLKAPKIEREEALFLSPDQVESVLEAAESSRYWSLFTFMALTAMRKGEALGLRWEDVDFANGSVSVRRTLFRLKGELRTGPPKSKSSIRTIYPAADVMALLKLWKREQAKDRLVARNVWQDGGFVFMTETGTAMDPRNTLRAFKVAVAAVGLPAEVTLHTLRHSAATAMLDGGIHIKAVSEMLGHAGTQITGDIYSHVTRATARKGMNALAKVIKFRGRGQGSGDELAEETKGA